VKKALANFFYWLLIRSTESHYVESLASLEVPSNSIKSFSLWMLEQKQDFNKEY